MNIRRGDRRKRRARGFSLLEVMIAGIVLSIAVVGMSGAILSAMAVQRGEMEQALARSAAQRTLEELSGVPFGEIFRTYDSDATNDAGLSVLARGPNFDVTGLTPDPADADGRCGHVMFPTVAVPGGEDLVENIVDDSLGMPLDLNRDGVIDALDHSNNYVVLPVRVRIEWRGLTGPEHYDLETILSDR